MADDIDDNFTDFGDLVSIELFAGLVDALNNCIESTKVGEYATIFVVDGITPPLNPSIWAEAIGGTVNDPLSPLNGQPITDMRDRYLVGAASLGQVGQEAGSNTKNVRHGHTGLTEAIGTGGNLADQSSGAYEYKTGHTHSVTAALSTTQNFEPAHFRIKHFLKIR
jgi:hypothetical protein